jgi:hypothetical protein
MERWIGMRRWDYVLFGVPAVLLATGAIMMIDGHILGEATASVASAIGLLGIFIMLYASRKSAAQKAKK